MAKELFVSKSDDLKDGDRKIVPNGNYEIGVYRVNGNLFAYQNVCPHQGGPACEGLLMAKVEEVIAEDKTYQGMTFNHDEMHIVCPWHGWEFDLETGDMVADRKFRLKKYDVAEKDDGILDLKEDEAPSQEMIQDGLAALTRLYTVRYQAGERWDPFVNGRGMPVTSVMIMSTAMLQAVNIELFELGMWQAWSGG